MLDLARDALHQRHFDAVSICNILEKLRLDDCFVCNLDDVFESQVFQTSPLLFDSVFEVEGTVLPVKRP
jgi:hypothetical protein